MHMSFIVHLSSCQVARVAAVCSRAIKCKVNTRADGSVYYDECHGLFIIRNVEIIGKVSIYQMSLLKACITKDKLKSKFYRGKWRRINGEKSC